MYAVFYSINQTSMKPNCCNQNIQLLYCDTNNLTIIEILTFIQFQIRGRQPSNQEKIVDISFLI